MPTPCFGAKLPVVPLKSAGTGSSALLSIYLSTYLSICLSRYPSLGGVFNTRLLWSPCLAPWIPSVSMSKATNQSSNTRMFQRSFPNPGKPGKRESQKPRKVKKNKGTKEIMFLFCSPWGFHHSRESSASTLFALSEVRRLSLSFP